MTPDFSLYIHIPFCEKRCAYCDFNTYAGQSSQLPGYIKALGKEIKAAANLPPEKIPLHTVYFGGGTPSLISAKQFEALFRVIQDNFEFRDPEISLEANPGTLSLEYLKDIHALGFNRISLGVQSAHPEELRFLERIHDYYDVIRSVEWIRKSGFANFNLDLIFGLPGQTPKSWQNTLSLATDFNPDHLSLYSLTIEKNTVLGRWARKGLIPIPDPDLSADMVEWAMEFLESLGYEQYEISNWSRPGFQCRHNLQYWRNLPYLGVGAGAHGFAFGMRYSNVLQIKTYIDRITENQGEQRISSTADRACEAGVKNLPAMTHNIRIDKHTEMQETMMVGLRLTREGVPAKGFQDRFGVTLEEAFGKEISHLIDLGLLEWKTGDVPGESNLLLTQRGKMVGNQVFQFFVGE
jgi:oxygen-independent coproporphyrinogen III oxidase